MSGTLTFPTVVAEVPGDIIARLAAQARPSDVDVDAERMHITYRFPTVERMCAWGAVEYEAAMRGECQDSLVNDQNGPQWYGADMATAMWMGAAVGWGEAVQLAVDVYDRLTATRLRSRIPVPVYADEPGDEVDVSAYLAGDDAFIARTDSDRTGAGRGAVVLRHSMFVSAGEDAMSIVTRGVVAAAVAHMLETSGVRVAIDLDMYAQRGFGGNYSMELECRLKDFAQPVDLPRLVYWMAHPSALRRVVFAVTTRHFTTHGNAHHEDDPEWVRVGGALHGDVMANVAQTLKAAGIEMIGGK